MHARRLAVVMSLLLPVALSAQLAPLPRIGGRGPAQPVPPSRQPEPIARAEAYRRLNISAESYPLISYFQAPSLSSQGSASSWTALGIGTRAEYRLTPSMSATLDLTSSFLGGPVQVHTAELGARFRPERLEERRVYPFVDARVGVTAAYDASFASSDDPYVQYVPTTSRERGFNNSYGFGGVAGVGMEYMLTHTLFLTTAASVLHSHMKTHASLGNEAVVPSYGLTTYRYTLGLKYNPIRLVTP
jgi:hypothetical protein